MWLAWSWSIDVDEITMSSPNRKSSPKSWVEIFQQNHHQNLGWESGSSSNQLETQHQSSYQLDSHIKSNRLRSCFLRPTGHPVGGLSIPTRRPRGVRDRLFPEAPAVRTLVGSLER